ncbi:TRAP transporter substrate-binding protein [Campylobacter geochelonis]|uniref:CjaC n=1 Tax=Campylobacter geochelonis TaxID=1780362 RepID=A0A128EGH3_9BACT|nr:TRAP transporter substrate-binding protein DctP [Campylobacter geochelonis]QKF70868.1 TRAP transporter, substrate binding protein, DctP family [Campylobacter geochelonis]CZE47980.1 CjaC [Campylobacter geochelonis]CZE48863.1 CjaC [Campylobacter geochelonis]CZE50632.1 CjaC [Campylobacter geochelonis]
MKKLLVFLTVLATFSVSLFADENKVYRLKLASSYESTMPILGSLSDELKKLVETMSNGRLQIRVDTPTKHKAPFAIYDMVKNGQYDLGYTASYYYKGKDSTNMLFTTTPFGMTTDEQRAWWHFGGGKELSEKFYSKQNLKEFHILNSGMQMGGWFRKEINSVEDLKGLKIRIPGFGGEVMSRLGAAINTIPIGELYMSLEMGTIDAVEWVSPSFDMSLGFSKIANYYYTGWQEPASENQVVVNLDVWNKLPKDLQAILQAALAEVSSRGQDKVFYENAVIWDEMKEKYPNVQVKSFPPEVMAALKKATNEILEEEAAKNPMFKEVLESQRAFLKKARAWTMISDFAYLENTNIK